MNEFRRRSDGSIDFEFYRTNASAQRRQYIRESAVLRRLSGALLAVVAGIGVLVVLASMTPASRGYADRAVPPATQLW